MRANRSWETLENHDNSGGPTITLNTIDDARNDIAHQPVGLVEVLSAKLTDNKQGPRKELPAFLGGVAKGGLEVV